jgi:hypothetical protein
MLGISRSYVSRIEKRAIKKLNKAMNTWYKRNPGLTRIFVWFLTYLE